MKHLSYRRIIDISQKPDVATETEKLHIDQCPFCANRLLSLNNIDKRIKETSKLEPIINNEDISHLADKIFDKYYHKHRKKSFDLRYLGASVLSAFFVVVIVLFVTRFFEQKTVEQLEDNAISSAQKEEYNEIESSETDKNRMVYLEADEKFYGQRYEVKTLLKSKIVEENSNFVTVKKGELTFSVEGGGDFIVNLNNIAFVRVIGTVFTVKVDPAGVSVNVSKGMVEMINLENGISTYISENEMKKIVQNSTMPKVKYRNKPQIATDYQEKNEEIQRNTALSSEMEKLFQYRGREDSNFDKPQTAPQRRYRFKSDPSMMEAEIRDLEFLLRFSNAPVAQLQQLFVLLSKRGHYGSIIHYWRVYSEQIQGDANPFLHEMHRYACEASVKLFLYDNGICRKYRSLYPEGPDPEGLNDHLNMAW
jgi:hypothetical protein